MSGAAAHPPCATPNEPASCSDRSLWRETAAGFVDRWGVVELSGKALHEPDPARLLAALAPQLQLARAANPELPTLSLAAAHPTPKRDPSFLVAAYVWSPQEQSAFLRTTFNGRLTVVCNDHLVLSAEGSDAILADQLRAPVTLQAGWNTLALRLDALPRLAPRLALRLRAPDGTPLSDLIWSPAAPPPAASDCPLPPPTFSATLTPAGWTLTVTPIARGLLPATPLTTVTLTTPSAPTVTAAWPSSSAAAPPALTSAPVTSPTSFTWTTSDDAHPPIPCATAALTPPPETARVQAAIAQALLVPELLLGPGDRDSLTFQVSDVTSLLSASALGDRDAQRRLLPTLAHLETHLTALAAGEPAFHTPGPHVRAYPSPYDGTLQRYIVVIPKRYDDRAASGVPAVVLAHGLNYTPDDMVAIALGKPQGPGAAYRSGFALTALPDAPGGAILIAPDGFANAGPRPPGEVDTFAVLDAAQAAYPIDPHRVTVSGFSLGGSVAFWAALRYPTRFAGAAPLCGYPDVLEYRSVKYAVKRPWEPRLLDEEGIAPYAENGRFVPMNMVHGMKDNPKRSELIHDRYRELGYRSTLDLLDRGHNIWDEAFEDGSLLRWLGSQRLPAVVATPRVRSGRYRFGEAFWLRIDRFTELGRFGELSGELRGSRIRVKTDNVHALTLIGGELGATAQGPVSLEVDGQTLGEVTVGDALLVVRDGAKGWAIAAPNSLDLNEKRRGREGPISDLWFDRFLVVYGTELPNEIEANRLAAERFAMYAPWVSARARIVADRDVSEADLAAQNLVLIGRPASNRVTARATATLSDGGIVFQDGALVVGERRFEGDAIGLSVVRPSPFSEDHLIVVHAGVGAEGTLSSRYIPDMTPDYLVYSDGIRATFGDRILNKREVLAGGFFDAHWRLPEGEPVTLANPAAARHRDGKK